MQLVVDLFLMNCVKEQYILLTRVSIVAAVLSEMFVFMLLPLVWLNRHCFVMQCMSVNGMVLSYKASLSRRVWLIVTT